MFQNLELRARAKASYEAACKKAGKTPENLEGTAATWEPVDSDYTVGAKYVGVLSRRADAGVEANGLQELITYGLKGLRHVGLFSFYLPCFRNMCICFPCSPAWQRGQQGLCRHPVIAVIPRKQ